MTDISVGRERFDNDPELELVGVVTDRLQPIFTDIGNILVVGHAHRVRIRYLSEQPL